MRCPVCGGETRPGIVKACGSTPFAVSLEYYPREEEHKLFKNGLVQLNNRAEGFRCEQCRRVFVCLEER